MRRNTIAKIVSLALLGCLGFCCPAFPKTNDASHESLPVRLGPIPPEAVQLKPEPPISESEAARIKQLIKGLADIDKPDFGLSPTLSGFAFAPIPSMRRVNSGLIIHHVIEDSSGLVELVKLGPKSLPFLLEALDDPTPTKLVMHHDGEFGGMFFANELSGNLANTNEQKILSWSMHTNDWWSHNSLTNYTVTVGDVCLVIIGQIVGRRYEAVRYQPTATIMINSPTHDPMIAKQVRTIWSGKDCRQQLYDSLLLDYSTEGIFNGTSLDGWGIASDLQCESAMRLLYYFPAAATNLLARRLDALNVGRDVSLDDNMFRSVSNGVVADDFLHALVWSEEPAIKTSIWEIFERTDNANVFAVCVKALDANQPDVAIKRVQEFFAKNGKFDDGPYADGYRILVHLGQKFGADAKPAFEAYLRGATVEQRYSMTQVLQKTQGQWSVELLAPMLTDNEHAERSDAICYEAAQTIALNFPKLSFKMVDDKKEMDAQIAVMREKIAERDF